MLTVTAKLSEKDSEYAYLQLARYVTVGAGEEKIDAAAIMSLLQRHKPKSGVLHRGLTVDSATAISILNNKKISLKRDRFPLISWAVDKSYAANFAAESYANSGIGIVLSVNVPMRDRVLDVYSEDVINATQEAISESAKLAHGNYGRRVGNLMRTEGEVLVKYNPNRKYTICKNITQVFVQPFIFHKHRGRKDLAAAVMDRFDDTTKEKVLAMAANVKKDMMFNCKGGELTLA